MKYLSVIGVTVAIVCIADRSIAKTPAEIESIAKVTVEIRPIEAETVGSGFIVDRGDTSGYLATQCRDYLTVGYAINCDGFSGSE
jgi:hypothetical protein